MKTDRKTCEKTMDTFLMLDKDEQIPLGVTLHLLRCTECRSQVRLLTVAERLAAEPLKIELPASAEKIRTALSAAGTLWQIEIKPVSLRRWVAGGIMMVLFMLVFGLFTRDSTDQALLVAFYLVFAGAVCSYCALFIGTNMDFFVKKIKTLI